METGEFEILIYQTKAGRQLFTEWLSEIRDIKAKATIRARIKRIQAGNLGDCKRVGEVFELRIFYGPGYRIYFNFHEGKLIILLSGGTKRGQDADIEQAEKYWLDFKERT